MELRVLYNTDLSVNLLLVIKHWILHTETTVPTIKCYKRLSNVGDKTL